MKSIIFDSGTLITFSMNCMLDVLRGLKRIFNGKFIITREVEREIVVRPRGIKKYKLGALRLKSLIDDGVLEFPESLNISDEEINRRKKEFLKAANFTFSARDEFIHVIDSGEAACLALSSILSERKIKNVIAIDERTTRMLFEKPENLRNLLEKKLHTKVEMKNARAGNFKFIRSTELIYVAFKKNLVKDKSADMLDAMLYGAKFKGCAISSEEIREIEKL